MRNEMLPAATTQCIVGTTGKKSLIIDKVETYRLFRRLQFRCVFADRLIVYTTLSHNESMLFGRHWMKLMNHRHFTNYLICKCVEIQQIN